MGGENLPSVGMSLWDCGSSPRGRGKQSRGEYLSPKVGLIPAWAGKTDAGLSMVYARAAHPRVGGENVGANGGVSQQEGSSLRGRGKPENAS